MVRRAKPNVSAAQPYPHPLQPPVCALPSLDPLGAVPDRPLTQVSCPSRRVRLRAPAPGGRPIGRRAVARWWGACGEAGSGPLTPSALRVVFLSARAECASRIGSARAASGRRAVARWWVHAGWAIGCCSQQPPHTPLIPAKAGIHTESRGERRERLRLEGCSTFRLSSRMSQRQGPMDSRFRGNERRLGERRHNDADGECELPKYRPHAVEG